MNCANYEILVSKLLDGELQAGDSATLFAHLASCGECRSLFHRMQSLNAALERVAEPPAFSPAVPSFPLHDIHRERLWQHRISLRVPALAFAALLVAAVVIYSLVRPRSTETVYVTKLATVIVTPEKTSTPQQK
jgi:predicted anti-sigma-YlaC factor YlaD